MALATGKSLPDIEDHDRLFASSVEHNMDGLLWSRVRRAELGGPRPWREALAKRDLLTQVRHRRLWQGLRETTSRLEGIGVEVAVIKGVPAESRWYDRMGERPCVDLDLLVHPDHLGRVREIVAALDPGHEMKDSFQGIFDRGIYQSMNLDVDGTAVDLHLDLFKLGPHCRHSHRLWEHTVLLPYPGGRVRVLDAELSLAHFLVHLNRDSFCRLLGYVDVARILDREEIDWQSFNQLVTDEGLQVPVWAGLSAVTTTLGMSGGFPSPQGWRSHLWRLLWRPSVRLQGDLGWMRYRHRPNWLPLVVDAGGPQALRWGWGQLALSEPLVTHANPGGRGPWWWRLICGRLGRVLERRRAVARLRRPGRWAENHGGLPRTGDG